MIRQGLGLLQPGRWLRDKALFDSDRADATCDSGRICVVFCPVGFLAIV